MVGKGIISRLRDGWGITVLTAVVLLLACACTKQTPVRPAIEEARVILSIRTPRSAAAAQRAASVQTPDETSVREVHVLVFRDAQATGDYRFAYMVRGSLLSRQQDGTTRFEAKLRTADVPLKLIVLANSGGAFAAYSPAVGQDEAAVRERLELAFPQGGMAGDLPMYGEVALPRIDAGETNTMDVTMLRAVARVDVRVVLDAGSPAFELREVRVYRANDRLRLIPDALAGTDAPGVAAPTVPSSAASLVEPLLKSVPEGTDSIGGLYLPESLTVSDSQLRRTAATTVVVGGIFGDDTEVSYYRVDFNSGVDGHPFGQVLRNYLYAFTVKRVSASGWPSPEEAAANMAASMSVEVQPWEDFTSEMYFHEDYFGVSTRNVRLPFLPGYSRTVDVESTMSYSMEWPDTPAAGAVSDYGVPLSDGYFTATILHDASGQDKFTHIRIEAPQYNTSDADVTATLRLRVNGTAVDIRVVKESPSRYSDRVMQVMSMGTSFGSMGDYATTVGYTLAMRRVLDANFSPASRYPFKTGGFFFLTVPVSTVVYAASTTPADVAYYKKMIDNVDILVLAYTTVTSPQVADMLFDEWLVEKPNRVLWVMMDATAYNAGISARLRQEGLGTWQDIAGMFDPAAGYRAASGADFAYANAQEAGQFFEGPFGTVGEGVPLFYSDAIAGVVQLPDSAKRRITPLVYNNNAPYDDYMSVGVETRRGVVYQGEAQLFQGGYGMSGMAGNSAQVNGTIVSAPQMTGTTARYYLDVLNANIWAWAVGRVIYGPPDDESNHDENIAVSRAGRP